VPLMAPPEDPPRDSTVVNGRNALNGATVVNMSPAVAEEMGMIEWRAGVAVVEVQPGSYASRFMRRGDMVTAINGKDVKTVADLRDRMATGINSVAFARDGMVQTVQFR
jgi:S1-C subfamily serine protease